MDIESNDIVYRVCENCKQEFVQSRKFHYYTWCAACRRIENEEKRKNAPWWAGFSQN